MVRLTTLAALLILAGPASAQTDAEVAARITPTLDQCQSAPENGGTYQQAVCEYAEASRQNDQLNKTWAHVIAGLPRAQQRTLRVKERAWIRRRDRECQSEANDYINSTARDMYAACLVDQTIRRRIWLERLARTPVQER